MTRLLAAIADDYTGASDLANMWRRAGLRTLQTIGTPDGIDTSEFDAVVVSLKIRSVASAQAVSAANDAFDWLQRAGAVHVMYKVCSTFDSTDAGNIGPVTDSLAKKAGADHVLVTPAFIETKRTVYNGHLFVGEELLSESPLRNHPLNPMHDANLVRVLSKQSESPAGLVALSTIRSGRSEVESRIAELVGTGVRSVVCDAVSDEDLITLGEIALKCRISTGASGLGAGLARAFLAGAQHDRSAEHSPHDATAPAAIVAGSCSARTLEQIEVAERTMPVLRLDPRDLLASGGDISGAMDWAHPLIGEGPFLIATSADPATVRDVQQRYGVERTSHVIEDACGRLAAHLVDSGVTRLVVAGGETSGAVVDHLGITAFRVGEEIAPGVPAMVTLGRPGGELSIALKSGNFGGSDFFEFALSKL